MAISSILSKAACSDFSHGKQYVFTYTTVGNAYVVIGTVTIAGFPSIINTLSVTTNNLLFKFEFSRDGTNWITSIEDYPVAAAATAFLSAVRNAYMYRVSVKPAGAGAHGTVSWTLTASDIMVDPAYKAAFAHESITVSSAHAESFTTATYDGATRANVTVENNNIRVCWDGTTPTSTTGHLMQNGDSMTLDFTADIYHFKAIATGGDAVIKVTYSR